MMPKVGGFVWSAAVLTSLSWAGCGSDQPLCAQVGQQLPLGDSPLALTRDAVLVRAGDGFVLAGLDGTTVRWGQLSSSGDISGESEFALPEQPVTAAGGQSLGPLFAVTSKTAPGDQLVVVMGVLQAGSTDQYEVHAWIHDPAAAVPLTMQVLGVQAAAPTSGTVRLVAGSSPDGTRALVAWGVEGQLAPIQYRVLGADGALVGSPATIYDATDPNNIAKWSCLDTTQNAPDLAITLVEAPTQGHPGQSAWRRFQIADDGSIGGGVQIDLDSLEVSDGRIVSTPTSDGYLLAWQNNTTNGGTYFASLTPPPPDAGPDATDEVTSQLVLASAAYGGYPNMPKLAWVAPAGYDFTIGLVRSLGPEVVRFDVFADPMGRALYLPSVSGNTSPVSAWVGSDAVYVTYLDMPGSSTYGDAAVPSGSQRYLVTVLSPAELP
jgi:hypothetical protein